MYTYDQVIDKQVLARAAKLRGAELLDDIERVCDVCNGIGAWWMPRWMRGAISALTPSLVIVADIHDLQYDLGGDAIDRLQDDADFLTNGYRMARYRYGRFDPRRILTRAMTLWYWRRLRRYGWSAFRHKKET